MGLHGLEEHKETQTGLFLYWAVLGCSCCIRDYPYEIEPRFSFRFSVCFR